MRWIFTFLLGCVISTVANAQLKKFKVEIPIQPIISITDSIQSVTIVNRSISPEFKNYDADSLQNSFFIKNFRVKSLVLDSVASDTTIKVMGDLLFNSQRFDIVIPQNCTLKRNTPNSIKQTPLSWDVVSEICDTFKTDALLVLEDVSMYVNTGYGSRYGYDNNYNMVKLYRASIDFYSRFHWRMYYPKKKQIVLDIDKNQDTLYWDSSEALLLKTFEKIPTVKIAAIETGIYSAKKLAGLITPEWKEVTRFYYAVKNKAIDQSILLASDGNWNGALQNWLSFVQEGNSSQRGKVMLNVALAYEMTGDLDKAIEWSKKSIQIYYREVVNFYLKELIARQDALKKKKVEN